MNPLPHVPPFTRSRRLLTKIAPPILVQMGIPMGISMIVLVLLLTLLTIIPYRSLVGITPTLADEANPETHVAQSLGDHTQGHRRSKRQVSGRAVDSCGRCATVRCSAASCSKVGLLCLLAVADANPFCNDYGTECNLACICGLTSRGSCGNTM